MLGFCIILIIVYPNQKNVLPDYVFRAASPQLIKRSHSPSHHTCAQCLCAPQGRCTGAVISPPLWKEILSSPAPRAAGERPTNPHPFKTQNGASTKSCHPPATADSPRPPLKLFSGHECANIVVRQLRTGKVHGESGTKSTHIILPVVPDSPCTCFGCPVQHFSSQHLVLPPRAPFRCEACQKTIRPTDSKIPRMVAGLGTCRHPHNTHQHTHTHTHTHRHTDTHWSDHLR